MRKFSPLEIMALSVLSEKARIARTAVICRKNGIDSTHRDCKIMLEKLGEPRGAKGRLRIALRDEIKRQTMVAGRRRHQREYRNWCLIGDKGFDPVSARFYGYSSDEYGSADPHERVKNLCLARIAPYADGLIPKVSWWNGSCRNWSVKETRLHKRGCLILVRPYWRSYRPEQKLQYLVYLNGKEAGYVIVPKRIRTIKKALESLESAPVKAAKRKGFDVKFDWTNQAFTVKSTRRKKARSIAWKSHTRAKRG